VGWPSGLGGKGSEGVTGLVKQTAGGIGYVELTYAKQNNPPSRCSETGQENGSRPAHSEQLLQSKRSQLSWLKACARRLSTVLLTLRLRMRTPSPDSHFSKSQTGEECREDASFERFSFSV